MSYRYEIANLCVQFHGIRKHTASSASPLIDQREKHSLLSSLGHATAAEERGGIADDLCNCCQYRSSYIVYTLAYVWWMAVHTAARIVTTKPAPISNPSNHLYSTKIERNIPIVGPTTLHRHGFWSVPHWKQIGKMGMNGTAILSFKFS